MLLLFGLVQGILDSDPQLAEHAEHLRYQYAQYQRTRDAIESAEGSLASFAKVPERVAATMRCAHWRHRSRPVCAASLQLYLLTKDHTGLRCVWAGTRG